MSCLVSLCERDSTESLYWCQTIYRLQACRIIPMIIPAPMTSPTITPSMNVAISTPLSVSEPDVDQNRADDDSS